MTATKPTIEQDIQTPGPFAAYLQAHLKEHPDGIAGERALDNACPIHEWLATAYPDFKYIIVNYTNIAYYDEQNKLKKIPLGGQSWIDTYIPIIDSVSRIAGDENTWMQVTYQQAWDALKQVDPTII